MQRALKDRQKNRYEYRFTEINTQHSCYLMVAPAIFISRMTACYSKHLT